MKGTQQPAMPLDAKLGLLAMQFRSTRNAPERAKVAKAYGEVVQQLIESGQWEEMPSFEELLPVEWMPDAFFKHWSLRRPQRPVGKLPIIVEGLDETAILRAILPPDVADACEFRVSGDRSAVVSAARSNVIQYHAPIAIVLDTDTVDPALLIDKIQVTKQEIGSVAGDVPFDIIFFIPEIEAVFFDDSIDLPRIFPAFKKVYTRKVAKLKPREQLLALLENGGGPNTLSSFLDELTSEDVERLQAKEPIRQLIAFIRRHRQPTARTT